LLIAPTVCPALALGQWARCYHGERGVSEPRMHRSKAADLVALVLDSNPSGETAPRSMTTPLRGEWCAVGPRNCGEPVEAAKGRSGVDRVTMTASFLPVKDGPSQKAVSHCVNFIKRTSQVTDFIRRVRSIDSFATVTNE
jgi:hypothetical protein